MVKTSTRSSQRSWVPAFLALAILSTNAAHAVDVTAPYVPTKKRLKTPAPTPVSVTESKPKKDSYFNFSYFMRYNGPALGHTAQETFNPFTNRISPVQMLHSVSGTLNVDSRHSIGAEIAGIQDMAYGVYDDFGNEIIPRSTLFDPNLNYWNSGNRLFDGLGLNWGASVQLPVTEFSRRQTLITSISFDQTWKLTKIPYPWRLEFNTRIQPFIYEYLPDYARTWFFSVGHLARYSFSDFFDITNTSLFDMSQSGGLKQSRRYDTASLDRTQLQLNFYSPARVLRVGLFAQMLVFDPEINKTTVGIDLTLSLDTPKF